MNSRRLVSSFFLMRHVARLALPLALATFVASCGERQQQGGGPPPPTVTVSKPVKRTVFDYDEYVGRFTAINSVEVRARVSGYLDKLHFKDGQLVKQGDLLFTIDKRPFQNTLDQARANLEQAKSNVAFTEADYTRGQQLVKDKTITDQTFEQRAQAFRNAKASVTQTRRRCGRPSSTWNSPICARRSMGASAIVGCRRATWSPAERAATRRYLRSSFRPIRSTSNSLSTRPRIYATSVSPKTADRTSPAATPAFRWLSSSLTRRTSITKAAWTSSTM